jgi:hypothetical protein
VRGLRAGIAAVRAVDDAHRGPAAGARPPRELVAAARGRSDAHGARDRAHRGRRRPGIGTCLTHALVAEALLRREGHGARIVIGIRDPHALRLDAHAWVESGGEVVVGSATDLDRFTPLAIGMDAWTLRSARIEP